MAMKKNISKALALAVMMSVFCGSAYAAGTNAVEVGSTNTDTDYTAPNAGGAGSIAIGNGALSYQDGNVAIGQNSVAWSTNGVAIGDGAVVNWLSTYGPNDGWNVAVGKSSTANVHSTALGGRARAGIESIAIGYNATAGYGGTMANIKNSIAIGNESKANVADSLALGNGAEVTKANSIAIGNNSKATEDNTVSVGNDTLKRKITNVAAGDITSATSTEAVTGGQIYTMTNVAKGNYIAAGTDVASNLTALDTQVKINADAIAKKADLTYVNTELDKKADASTVSALDTRVTAVEAFAGDISALQSDVATNKSDISTLKSTKADKSYVDTELGKKADVEKNAKDIADNKKKIEDHETRIADLEAIAPGGGASTEALEKLDSKINQTNDRVDRVGATAAALAGIHYQPMAKGQSQVAVGMGGYKGKKATALGLAYQISDRVSGSVAGAANGSEHMFNVGFNYLFGQHSDKDIAQCAAAPGSVSLKEAELQAQVDSLKANNEAMQARMAQLEAMVKALAAK